MLKEIGIGVAVLLFGGLVSAIGTGFVVGVKWAVRFAVIEDRQKYFAGQMRSVLRRLKMTDDSKGED